MTTVTVQSSKPPITLSSGRGITITIDRSVTTSSGGGSGTVTSVTGTAPVVITGTPTTVPNVTITAVTTVAAGVMSSADKLKLDGIGTGATVTGVTGTAPISSSGGAAPVISIAAVTTVAAGSMSSSDKSKLDGIGTGATVTGVTGTAPIASSGGAAPVISIAAASTSAAGSMSSADKTILNTLNTGYVVISKTTFSTATASVDINPTGYSAVRIVVLGKGDSAATSVGVRMRINNSTASEYLINAAVATTQFNNNGSLPGSLTNTDRLGYWEADLLIGGVGKYTVGLQRGAHILSNATVGVAPTTNSLFFTGVGAAITSILVQPSAGNFDTGSKIIVLGLA
jgi:hypothetical protein